MLSQSGHYAPLRLLTSRAGISIALCVSTLLILLSQTWAPSTVFTRFQSLQITQGQCPHDTDVSPYRQRLSKVRPLDSAPHSRTLGVAGRIYVVNLPARTDRREDMSILADAMGLEFTWHNATDYHSKEIQDVRERLRWWRNEHRVNSSVPKQDPSPFVFQWADDVDEQTSELGLSGADFWTDTLARSPLPPLPPPPSPDTRPPVLDAYGEDGTVFGDHNTKPAQYSCWHSHYQLLRKIAEGEDEVAIVFEDDIDMEWDLEARLRGMWQALPQDWDMVMIGHCQSQEWKNPPLKGAPNLHPAYHTLCTHAYAVTRRAAQRIVRRLRTESFAYSRNVDHAIQHLNWHKHIRVFSVYPPVVVQTYESQSDIMPGRPGGRQQELADSALERIALAKKMDLEQEKEKEVLNS